jgi:hypothetical protein
VFLLQVVKVCLQSFFVYVQVDQVIVQRLIVPDQHFGLLAQSFALVFEAVDFTPEIIAGLVVPVVEIGVVVFSFPESLLRLAQFNGGAVVFLLQFRLAEVVVV